MDTQQRRTIIVTGAGSGSGYRTARRFAERGWFVGAYDRNAEGLQKLLGKIGPVDCMTGLLDVTDAGAFREAAERFADRSGGRLDILFNNAGVLSNGYFEDILPAQEAAMIDVNIRGVLNGTRACLPLLKATPNSLCINMSSASAFFGKAGIAVYSASKAAVKALTESLSIEFQRFDIRVADLLPGKVATPMLPDHLAAELPKDGPLRLVSPDEIFETVMAAYSSDQIHWYVPRELKELAVDAARDPEAMRLVIANTRSM